MRWPSTPPGMVRIRSKRLIELQTEALAAWRRAAEVEVETARLNAETAHYEAQTRALALLRERDLAFELDHRQLLADLPTAEGGRLHEPAFLALVDHEQQWLDRSRLAHAWATQQSNEEK